MGEIIDKVKEEAKDVKDKVIVNTKDVADATKESFSVPSSQSSSIDPNPTFISSSVTYVSNPEKNNSDKEIEKVYSPLTEHRVSEQKIFSTDVMQDNKSIKTNNTASFDSEVTQNQNQQIDKQQQYDYKENDEFFNPFLLSMKLWQNYYTSWMNFYSEALKSFDRSIRNI
jgi:hypothetical protein